MAAIQECGFQPDEHPPHSLDLAPSDYYLFPKTKKKHSVHHFRHDDDLKQAVRAFLEAQDITFHREGIEMLQHRWTTCASLQGDDVEK